LTACRKKIPASSKTTGKSAGTGRARKNPVRPKPRGDTGRALGDASKLSPLAQLIHALGQEKIRFQIAGMTAAILQGAPATTLDTDIWIDLPERQYVRVLNLCQKFDAEILA
jgi:hypothetical protein